VSGNPRLSGNFSHPLTYGYYIVTATIFLSSYLLATFKHHSRWRLILLGAATIFGLAAASLSNSRGPLLALGVGLLAIGVLQRKIRYTLAALVLALAFGFMLSPGLFSEFANRIENDLQPDHRSGRLNIWNNSLKIVSEHPWIGVGPGNFKPAYAEHLSPDSIPEDHLGHAHNDFLNMAATTGIPGLICYLGFWAMVLTVLWRGVKTTLGTDQNRAMSLAALVASLAFLTASMTEAAFADEELRQLLTALWAFGLSDVKPTTSESEEVADKCG